MFYVVFLVKKRHDMSQEDFTRYWIDEHTPLTAKVPGVRSYRCYPSIGTDDTDVPFEAVAVLGFDSEEEWRKAESSPELADAIGDAPNFQAADQTKSFYAIEEVIV
jgi:uncharacterized protein (TIGR02118 family)